MVQLDSFTLIVRRMNRLILSSSFLDYLSLLLSPQEYYLVEDTKRIGDFERNLHYLFYLVIYFNLNLYLDLIDRSVAEEAIIEN